MKVTDTHTLGRTDVSVTALSFGAAPIGNFRRPFTQADAEGMIRDAWERGIRSFDTAPSYGNGLSEHRLGHALYDVPRNEVTISTKTGYVLRPRHGPATDAGLWTSPAPFNAKFDYSYDGVMRSVESSLDRLLVDHLDIVYMHDADTYTHGGAQAAMFRRAIQEGFPALVELKSQGVIRAIGFGVNESEVCVAAMKEVDLDVFLLAGRYTLLEQEPLDDLLPGCLERGIAVVLGGVYNSGILATGPVENAHFNYGPAPADVLERAQRLQTVCDRYGVPLAAAAAQFSMAHPAVVSVCLGARNLAQQAQNVAWFQAELPDDMWSELRAEALLREDAPTPVGRTDG